MEELTIITREAPGVAVFDNFDEIKAYLERSLEVYRGIVYSVENLDRAKQDEKTLKKLKKALDDRRKEIKRVYMEPYLAIEAQIKELTALIDEPLGRIDSFVKQADEAAKAEKRAAIKAFYDGIAPLGELAEPLFSSAGFYDKKWENKSTSAKVWQDAVREKVAKAAADLHTLQAAGGAYTPALVARYFETMDIEDTVAYKRTLEATATAAQTEVAAVEDEDRVVGYKTLKIFGTRRQMAQLLEQMELMGVEYEELEDGMPGELAELTVPDFDSFVAFDIETTGTFGAAGGDAPAEITEIGAVKVVNGEIVAREDWLCNPGRRITPMVSRITHITDDMVADKPPVSGIIRAFAEFTGDLPLVGHNIKSSDLHYITRAANRAGVRLENRFFDTYRYAKRFQLAQGWPNVKLETLAQLFGIEQSEAHRAWCDAEANVGVFFKLKEMN